MVVDSFLVQNLKRIGFAATVLTIAVLSLLPERLMPSVALSDNTEHMLAYTVLTALGLLTYRGIKGAAIVIAGAIALGGALELAQLLTPSRSAELGEFLFDCVGVMVGFVLVSIWSLLRHQLVGLKERRAE